MSQHLVRRLNVRIRDPTARLAKNQHPGEFLTDEVAVLKIAASHWQSPGRPEAVDEIECFILGGWAVAPDLSLLIVAKGNKTALVLRLYVLSAFDSKNLVLIGLYPLCADLLSTLGEQLIGLAGADDLHCTVLLPFGPFYQPSLVKTGTDRCVFLGVLEHLATLLEILLPLSVLGTVVPTRCAWVVNVSSTPEDPQLRDASHVVIVLHSQAREQWRRP